MLKTERLIKEQLDKGIPIYEIALACPYKSDKPSKTEPGQAMSITARVKLLEAGLGSGGFSEDMFEFVGPDKNASDKAFISNAQEAIAQSDIDLLPAGVSSLSDVVNHRIAMLARQVARANPKAGATPAIAVEGPDGHFEDS